MTKMQDKLKFKVAPNIVEDLGLNLYTNLPRVLVEYVANSFDADSPAVNIQFDANEIARARKVLKKEHELEQARNAGSTPLLETKTLSDDFAIVIEDTGYGMSRSDLNDKFLFAGRRRRKELTGDPLRTPNRRLIMGRKGIGKLAGFGVAKIVTVITRKAGEDFATKIVLDYDELVKQRQAHEIVIEEEKIIDGGGFDKNGTKIILSRLLYGPLKSRNKTIEKELIEHFSFISPEDFSIYLSGKLITPDPPEFAFAWPVDDSKDHADFIEHRLSLQENDDDEEESTESESDDTVTFSYRIRFTGDRQALTASKRGVRVYSNQRLASAPSLLDANTNMHGFRMTDYLDGVVQADFIDEQDVDYIATDRQSLRWETPLLAPLRAFLSKEIKVACTKYQKVRDANAKDVVKKDEFTIERIKVCEFSRKDKKLAYSIAALLKSACKKGVEDDEYKEKLLVMVQGIAHGTILTAISSLASEKNPDLQSLATEVAKLTKDELDRFITTVKSRIKAIETLKRIVDQTDFKDSENEGVIQKLFEKSPWLLDPTFTQFLTANQPVDTLLNRLAHELKIGENAATEKKENAKRPDLVFLIGSSSLCRLVIVELKSANLPLEAKHLAQLRSYMQLAKKWLEQQQCTFQIHGHLIGTMPAPNATGEGALALHYEMDQAGPNANWVARDYLQVLQDTEAAHNEILKIRNDSQESES